MGKNARRRTGVQEEAGANDGMIQEWGRWRSEGMVKLYRRAFHGDTLYRKYTPMEFLKDGC